MTTTPPPTDAAPPATGHGGGVAGRVPPCSRRALLQRAGAGGAVLGAAGLLAACGGTGEPAGAAGSGSDSGSSSSSGGTSSSSGGAGSGSGGQGVPASQVPEGSAVVVEVGGEQVVLAQPSAGQYVAYSAVCTHAGGIVQPATGTQVRCPLHGSVFDAGQGGEVLKGPANAPLPSVPVTPEGDQLVVG